MLLSKVKLALTVVLPLAALGLGSGLMMSLASSPTNAAEKGTKAANDKPSAAFSEAEFQELKARLDVHNQPWASIPWQVSLTEARQLAARTRKPIFMAVGTGNTLGWG